MKIAESRIFLPSDVRVQDMADAIGLLLGLKAHYKKSTDTGKPEAHVDGVHMTPSVPDPPFAILEFRSVKPEMVDGLGSHHVFFKVVNPSRELVLEPMSTPTWVAVGQRLVDFFGGWMFYRTDRRRVHPNYRKPKPRPSNSPKDEQATLDFMAALYSLAPITSEDIMRAGAFAGRK